VYTNKKLRILFLALLLVGMFVGNLCAQEAVTAEDTTAIVEEAVVVEETAQTGGMEAFARKIVGSGLVDLFIKVDGSCTRCSFWLIWALATSILEDHFPSLCKISVHVFLSQTSPFSKRQEIR